MIFEKSAIPEHKIRQGLVSVFLLTLGEGLVVGNLTILMVGEDADPFNILGVLSFFSGVIKTPVGVRLARQDPDARIINLRRHHPFFLLLRADIPGYLQVLTG